MRQIRLEDATPQSIWRASNLVHGTDDIIHQLVHIERAATGEFSLSQGPNTFVGIKLRSVGRKVLDPQARVATAQPCQRCTLVRGGIVQQGDEWTPEVPQQLAEKHAHLFLPDIVEEKQIVEA
jgi:hypothetical protein